MRVLILNNYDLDRVAAEVSRGDKPAHHLFGVDELRRVGWAVEIVPTNGGPAWLRAFERFLRWSRFPVPFGDLSMQWRAWSRSRHVDVIYAPCQTQTQAFSYLRACGFLRTPLVVVAHHPPCHGRLAGFRRWCFGLEARGVDRYPALSGRVAEEVRRLAGRPENDFAPVLAWGPDLDFYDRYAQPGVGEGVVATGRTGRDWISFGRGATRAGGAVEIFCFANDVRPEFSTFGANVRVHPHASEADLPYPKLLTTLAHARVVAVPLAVGPAVAGLTSVSDALGLGRPLLVTRHPLLDIDIEAEGIGRWVAPGDAEDWARALRWFDEHPDEAAAMGRRARVLAERRWNSRLFAAQLVALLRQSARPGSETRVAA